MPCATLLSKFIEKAINKYGNKYDYSQVNYVNNRTKVDIVCPSHGIFQQRPDNHLYSNGCPKCRKNSLGERNFIKRAIDVHGDKYDYSHVNYANIKSKVTIICPTHGVFEQKADSHISGHGCNKCKYDDMRLTLSEFISNSNHKHDFKYDYTKVKLTTVNEKVTIICDKHGEFEQRASNHLNGNGCPSCTRSLGEEYISSHLDTMGITYTTQHTFSDCRHRRLLPFDFYLPNHNMVIEYHGQQHYEFVKFFHRTYDHFELRVLRDNIKQQYCENNGIRYIQIKYTDYESIDSILNEELNTPLNRIVK